MSFARGSQFGFAALIGRLDTNKDGKISKDEVLAHHTALDRDGDGEVTREEMLAHFREQHRSQRPEGDKQKDEKDTKAKDARETEAGKEGERPQRRPFGAQRPGQAGGFRGFPSPDQVFSRLDKNSDGKLSKDELPEGLRERLSNADTDKDGEISKSEFEEHSRQMRERFGRGAGDDARGPRRGGRPGRDSMRGRRQPGADSAAPEKSDTEKPAGDAKEAEKPDSKTDKEKSERPEKPAKPEEGSEKSDKPAEEKPSAESASERTEEVDVAVA